MSGLRRFVMLLILILLFGLLAPTDSLHGQTPKDKAKKGKGLLTPEPYQIMPGDPLSARALVTRPPLVKNAMSWTIETKRHRWSAIHVSASPDGALAATSGYDGMIRIWDLTTGKFLRVLVGHAYYGGGVAWSPDGTMLATSGGSDATARIWNPRNGMTLRVLTGHKGATGSLAWSPDGKHLVVTGGGSGFATFWDIDKNKQLKTLEHGTGVYSVAWSPDSRYVACGVAAGGFLWNAETYTNVRTTKQDGNIVTSVAFSPDAKYLLTGGQANSDIWEVDDGKKLQTIPGIANIASWCPDNQSLLIAASGGPPQQFESKSYKTLKTLPMTVGSMSWAREGKTLVSVLGDKLTVYDMVQSKIVQTIAVAGSWPLAWHPGKPVLAGYGTKSMTLWDGNTGRLVHTLDGHSAAINVAMWAPNGKFLATASADKTVRLWDGQRGTFGPVRTLVGLVGSVTSLAWSPDGRLATGGIDGIVRIFPAGNEKVRELKSGKTPPIASLAWSRDGRTLASAASGSHHCLESGNRYAGANDQARARCANHYHPTGWQGDRQRRDRRALASLEPADWEVRPQAGLRLFVVHGLVVGQHAVRLWRGRLRSRHIQHEDREAGGVDLHLRADPKRGLERRPQTTRHGLGRPFGPLLGRDHRQAANVASRRRQAVARDQRRRELSNRAGARGGAGLRRANREEPGHHRCEDVRGEIRLEKYAGNGQTARELRSGE